MQKLHAMRDWKLERGSHTWPGPGGGTCINEAAIVAAGFPYRAVNSVEDCPPCFSRVLASYLLTLNDQLNDRHRQCLLHYAGRLAGTADAPSVEQERASEITRLTISLLWPVLAKRHPDPMQNAIRARLRRMTCALDAARIRHAAMVVAVATNAELVPPALCLQIADAAFAIGKQSELVQVAEQEVSNRHRIAHPAG